MIRAAKSTKSFAKKLVILSLDPEGRLSGEKVAGILHALTSKPPRKHKIMLKLYLRTIKQEIQKSRAVVEYAGSIQPHAVEAIKEFLSSRYRRAISVVTRENANLIAGLRLSVADDVYDTSIAGRLEMLTHTIK